jgi:hypothetical protein
MITGYADDGCCPAGTRTPTGAHQVHSPMSKGSKHFFFEKKKQTTFMSWCDSFRDARSETKVFWFFFSKKTMLPVLSEIILVP